METQPKQPKNKKLNICLSEYEYSLLVQIKANHRKSISQLIRDSIIFYGLYYTKPNQI